MTFESDSSLDCTYVTYVYLTLVQFCTIAVLPS